MPSWGKTIQTPVANTAYKLLARMQVVDPNSPIRVEVIQIQADPAGGAAKFWVGNVDITPANHGVELVATQAMSIQSLGGDVLALDDVYIMCDTDAKKWNIYIVVR